MGKGIILWLLGVPVSLLVILWSSGSFDNVSPSEDFYL